MDGSIDGWRFSEMADWMDSQAHKWLVKRMDGWMD